MEVGEYGNTKRPYQDMGIAKAFWGSGEEIGILSSYFVIIRCSGFFLFLKDPFIAHKVKLDESDTAVHLSTFAL